MDIRNFYNGDEFAAYEYFGAHLSDKGTVFRTYAPNASAAAVIGDFSGWEDIPMKPVCDGRMYEITVPEAKEGMRYKYRIYDSNGNFIDHCDPYGFGMEVRPGTCSVIRSIEGFEFTDGEWLRERSDCRDKALNIYEVHLGSWKRRSDEDENGWYGYLEIADELIDYVCEFGYNYIELMPLSEHPCDESWGYQCTGFFAPTSRYGTPKDLMEFVNKCHERGIGVIVDFVPVHFAVDHYALTEYDGTKLYEYPSDDIGYNEWGSRNFNHSKGEVRSFIQSAADYWLSVYHFDGLRMDAIRNMIYWNGDERRGENKNAIKFIKSMNCGLKARHSTAIIAAEDSSSYPNVTAPVFAGGLGFDYKWDLGWMHDTLEYFQSAPMYRSRDYHKLTFSMLYFFNEKFILPLSHDEVVHGKATVAQKMNGQYEVKFPQARALYMYMIMHSGKKLNFMGSEFAQLREWDEKRQQDWDMLKYPMHDSFREYIKKLNHIYLKYNALHYDYDPTNFEWADCNSIERCVYAVRRKASEGDILAVFNFSDWCQFDYSVNIGEGYTADLLLDSDDQLYSGRTPDGQTRFSCEKEKLIMEIPPFSGRMFLLTKK
ncbi:MAG: 1,4-alpha-glucan branching protein GlgB [Ruminococcus sp.]|uniref:1,4-alpha-glucan branching protein GlgB n=1 Tax=Ruminococcus sp. TaxID=41978 RepID=UPI0025F0CC7B|nr:1,4-alpha-glucan branching protein GlgB [Ruminococcus sp.]MCR5599762.1 1,4-alpha-glucan branching protein GlgB [Ruminococcus sp.]